MVSETRPQAPNTYHHVYNRGIRKQRIFQKKRDYARFLTKVAEYKEKYKISVICYCLIPNHFHFILRQNSEFPIARFIQDLCNSHARYFNLKYNFMGPLFEGKFRSKLIRTDAYLFHLSRYIHLNSLIHHIVESLESWPWSSYLDYVGKRKDVLCEKERILGFARNRPLSSDKETSEVKKYETFVKDGIEYTLAMKSLQSLIEDMG